MIIFKDFDEFKKSTKDERKKVLTNAAKRMLNDSIIMRDLHFSELKLPKLSNETITVYQMPIKEIPPFLENPISTSNTKQKRVRKNIGTSENLIQDRAKVIFEILVNGLNDDNGNTYRYPNNKKVYYAKDKDIEQFCFEYEYKNEKLSIIVVNKYGNAIYITKKQLNLDSDNPRKISISELQDRELTIKFYGKKDEDIFLENKNYVINKLIEKINALI